MGFLASVFLIATGWLGSILVNGFIATKRADAQSHCLANMRYIAEAMVLYVSNYDERLPLAENWQGEVEKVSGYELFYTCPEGHTPWNFALNKDVAGKDVHNFEAPHGTVVLFECEAATPSPVGGKEWWVKRHIRSFGKVARSNMVDGWLITHGAWRDDRLHWKP
jgi:hypothetical protein